MKRDDAGFTLIEIVCVLAIIALLAGLVLPSIPRATSGPRLEAYALQAASIPPLLFYWAIPVLLTSSGWGFSGYRTTIRRTTRRAR